MTPSERTALVLQMREAGATLEQIGNRLGVSRQTVERLMKPRRAVRGRPCQQCGAPSRLLWARERADGSTKRRRECTACGFRWNRVENDEEIVAPTADGSATT